MNSVPSVEPYNTATHISDEIDAVILRVSPVRESPQTTDGVNGDRQFRLKRSTSNSACTWFLIMVRNPASVSVGFEVDRSVSGDKQVERSGIGFK